MRISSKFFTRMLALLAICWIGSTARADDSRLPDFVLSKRPIDVRNLHLTQTTQVRVARFDIDENTSVGSLTLNGTCSGGRNYSLGAYETLNTKTFPLTTSWAFDLAAVQKIFATEMDSAGYLRYQPDLSLFETHLGSDADFQTAVTFTNMQFNKCSHWYLFDTSGISYIKARIEVFSQKEQKTVLDKIVEAALKIARSDSIEDREFNRRLIAQLADNLLADPDYVAIFHSPASSVTAP
jgi:hypothetical protein